MGTRPEGEIAQKIQDYADGKLTEDQIVQYLAHEARYIEPERCPFQVGTPEWWEWHEGQPFQPGTYDEVTRARSFGLISFDTFEKVNLELERGAQKP